MRGLPLRSSSILTTALAILLTAPPGLDAQGFDGTCTFRGSDEDLANRLSPLDSATVELDGESAKICYGRPSARDREIFGQLVPFGEPWRLGANEPTRLHLPFSARLGDLAVEPGGYSLYVVPSREEWEIFVNRSTDRWGVPISGDVRADDVGSFTVPVESTDEPVETFTISFRKEGSRMAEMVLEWVQTRVVVPLTRTNP